MTFFATLKEAQCYCQSYYDDDNQLRNCTCGVCPGGKQPEIKKFRKDFTYIGKEGRDWKAMPRDVESFLKQALTKSFEAGQKSREKEIVEIVNSSHAKLFDELKKHPDYPKYDSYSIDCLFGMVREATLLGRELESLSLTKELK